MATSRLNKKQRRKLKKVACAAAVPSTCVVFAIMEFGYQIVVAAGGWSEILSKSPNNWTVLGGKAVVLAIAQVAFYCYSSKSRIELAEEKAEAKEQRDQDREDARLRDERNFRLLNRIVTTRKAGQAFTADDLKEMSVQRDELDREMSKSGRRVRLTVKEPLPPVPSHYVQELPRIAAARRAAEKAEREGKAAQAQQKASEAAQNRNGQQHLELKDEPNAAQAELDKANLAGLRAKHEALQAEVAKVEAEIQRLEQAGEPSNAPKPNMFARLFSSNNVQVVQRGQVAAEAKKPEDANSKHRLSTPAVELTATNKPGLPGQVNGAPQAVTDQRPAGRTLLKPLAFNKATGS